MSYIYIITRALLRFVAWIFFREISIDGDNNIPTDGAVIFVGNHQNQFMDALLMMLFSPRKIGFLVAKKSMSLPVVGTLAKMFHAIPVVRPQDNAKKGDGSVIIEEGSTTVTGKDTNFTTQFLKDNSLALPGEDPRKVLSIQSDTQLTLASGFKRSFVNSPYKILDNVDQSNVYEHVWTRLGEGHCIGIFPEGGSHDRSELLPLKAGVTLMALGTMVKYDTPVYIVPCGLNYFHGHRFRGSVLVQFGRPYLIPKSLAELYDVKEERRRACNMLLEIIKANLETVITHAPDQEQLQNIKLIRKLYQPTGVVLTSEQYLELHHRFLHGYQKLKEINSELVENYLADINNYRRELNTLGLDDRHMEDSTTNSTVTLIFIIVIRLIVVLTTLFLALPGSILNLPTAITARYVATKHAAEALKSSEVKIEAKDVLASKKVIVAICMFPVLYTLYTFLVFWFYGLYSAVFFFVCFPIVTVATILVAEEGISIAWSLVVMLHMKNYATKIEELKEMRKNLQKRIRDAVKQFGSSVTGIESGEFEDWRIIKEDQIEEADKSPESNSPAIRVKKQRHFDKHLPTDKTITDAEWEELKDVFS
jgi:glycerol-3-phosphate O-acyltransferase/dihydroxyacetone phosphate acyltransferase